MKPWQRAIKSYPFTSDGCMTRETARAWNDHSDRPSGGIYAYAEALGITVEEAQRRVDRQQVRMEVDEQKELGI